MSSSSSKRAREDGSTTDHDNHESDLEQEAGHAESESKRGSAEDDHSMGVKSDDPAWPSTRPMHVFQDHEMATSIDKTLLALFCKLPQDCWVAWKQPEHSATMEATKRPPQKVQKVNATVVSGKDNVDPYQHDNHDRKDAGEIFLALPTCCLTEISSFLQLHEVVDLLQSTKAFHARKAELHQYRVAATRKCFALLPILSDAIIEESVQGGWQSLVEFFAEVHRKMAAAYGKYNVLPLHRALVGERVMISLCGRHDKSQCFHNLTYQGCMALVDAKNAKIKPTFAHCFKASNFDAPYVLLGDQCEGMDDDDSDEGGASDGYLGVPFLVAPDHCGGWNYNITVDVPNPPHSRGITIRLASDQGMSEFNQSPFGSNWPSLVSFFCMDTYSNESYASSRVQDWEARNVAWLMQHQVEPFTATNRHISTVAWKALINHFRAEDDFDDTKSAVEQPDCISSDALSFLSLMTERFG